MEILENPGKIQKEARKRPEEARKRPGRGQKRPEIQNLAKNCSKRNVL